MTRGRRNEPKPSADPRSRTPDPPEALPEGWTTVYDWTRRATPSTAVAERLAVEVCRRVRSGGPVWLSSKPVEIQQRFFVAQVLLERRGVLPARPSAEHPRPDRRR